MRSHLKKQLSAIMLCVALFACVEILAESFPHNGEHKSYHYLEILSDPAGAYVYGSDGSYWGKTEEDAPVVRLIWENLYWDTADQRWHHQGTTEGSEYFTIILK